MNPFAGLVIFGLALIVLLANKRFALLAMVAGVLFLTQGQQIQLFGLSIYPTRVLEAVGFLRVVLRQEAKFGASTDYHMLMLYLSSAAIYCLRSSEGSLTIVGSAIDALLSYFVFRGLLNNFEDYFTFLKSFLFLLTPFVLLVLVQAFTGVNPFGFMGGVSHIWEREGRFRCQGSFRHPVLMGTLGATFLPLYIGYWFKTPSEHRTSYIGVLLSLAIVWASNSGGPVNAACVAVAGWMLWPQRQRMRAARWTFLAMILMCAFMMKAPVWYLIARASQLTGGDGWHRAYLLDVAFRNIDLWWFAGMPLKDTAEWFPYSLSSTGGADITNQFISFGLDAGLLPLSVFVFLLAQAFRTLGVSMSALRHNPTENPAYERTLWGLGAMLAAHIANWFGVAYFDQFQVVWFMQLAMITNLANSVITKTRPQPDLSSASCVH